MYLLRNKDKDILSFQVKKKETEVTNPEMNMKQVVVTYQIYIDSLYEQVPQLPLQMQHGNCPLEELNTRLETWLKSRKIPKNRAFVDNLMNAIDPGTNPFKYIDVTYGLSLNDSFWICPLSERKLTWKDVNLYRNPFDKQVARLAFTGIGSRIHGLTTTPEFTTNGALRKCWHREDNQIYLLKGGSERFANGGLEPYIEVFASKIAQTMNLNHVPYEVAEFHGILVSKCPLFTDENTGFIPIYHALGAEYFQNHSIDDPQTWQEIGIQYGIEPWEDLLFFDAVIANEDRHLGNFGFLIDNDKNQIKSPAPLFDHGNSLFFNATNEEFRDIFDYASTRRSFIGLPFDKQAQLFLRSRHLPGLKKLAKLTLPRYENPQINKISKQLEHYLHVTSEKLILLYEKRLRNRSPEIQIRKNRDKGIER